MHLAALGTVPNPKKCIGSGYNFCKEDKQGHHRPRALGASFRYVVYYRIPPLVAL